MSKKLRVRERESNKKQTIFCATATVVNGQAVANGQLIVRATIKKEADYGQPIFLVTAVIVVTKKAAAKGQLIVRVAAAICHLR
jgi:hypothetical protein